MNMEVNPLATSPADEDNNVANHGGTKKKSIMILGKVVQDDVDSTKSSEADAIESGDAEDVESSAVLDETQNTASAEGDETQDVSQETPSK